jgi:myo-inositol 2-dehydrogenase/D-chiro-inositol 1-dehydrogenase
VGFNRRFDEDFNKIHRLVKSNHIGKPHFIKITSRDPNLPSSDYLKQSGGMFLDMSIHDFDMARFVMGAEITEVFARGSTLIDQNLNKLNDIDTAIILLKFSNGAFGAIDNSRQAVYGYDQRLEIFGTKGCLFNKNHSPTTVTKLSEKGFSSEPMLNFFLQRYACSYLNEMRDFLQNCNEHSIQTPNLNDSLSAVEICHAANKSLTLNRPITLGK